jgi:DNA-directed RNA polymerase I, II, and III subunit RPABC2
MSNYFSDDENENVDENASNAESEDETEVNMADAIGEDTDEEVEEEEPNQEADENDDDESLPLAMIDQEDESDEEEESYLQKFDSEVNKNYILDYHPECEIHTQVEIMAMAQVVRDELGNIIDELHRTLPFITKFERARIIGQRASQINSGSKPFISNMPDNMIDGYLIAEMELEHKAIPFIIRRPLPNGGSEYWKIKDLQNIIA